MGAFANRDVIIAGIISKVRHETAKNGNPYGRFMLEDFDESIELSIYKEDYLKYRHLLNDDTVVLLRLHTAARYSDPTQFEARIQRISLLGDAMDEMAKALLVYVPVDALSDLVTSQLIDILKKNKGNCKLRIELVDHLNNYRVETISSQHKVLCSSVIRQLRSLPALSMKVKA